MMTRPIPEEAMACVKRFEGCKLKGYLDVAGIPTIGYGHTGPDVAVGLVITQAQADALLLQDMKVAAARLKAKIGEVVESLTEAQYSALLSFVFNLGTGAKKPEWRIWKLLKDRQLDQVPAEFGRFINAGGRPVKGLVNRRAAEAALWAQDASDEVLPSSATRAMPTPPTPAASSVHNRDIVTMAGSAIAGGTVAVTQITQAVSPYAAQSPHVAQMIATLAMVAAGLAVAALVIRYLQKKHA